MKRVKCTQGLRRFLNGLSSTQQRCEKGTSRSNNRKNLERVPEESVLIVFSVVLALLLTTLFQKLHENKQTREVLHELREELITNKKSEEIQLTYHLQVLKNIDSALADPAIAQKFINNGVLNLKIIAPEGVLYRDLNDVAWEVAKQNNIFAKLDLRTYSLLTNIYANQQ